MTQIEQIKALVAKNADKTVSLAKEIWEYAEISYEETKSGMTILIVTHEMGFAREVSDRVLFICDGVIKEEGSPDIIFTSPHDPATNKFLSMVL